ncbi:MAG: hypothetical protein AAGL34_08170 [Bacteroidota bacterium]
MNLIDDFFIIESLGAKDINDGKIFYDSLNSLKSLSPIYIIVNDFNELSNALKKFEESNYINLLISAHGDHENLILNSEVINTYDLFDIDVKLNNRRILMSSCKGGSFLFAKYFIKKGAYSVIGTPDNLSQFIAVGMWPTFLVLIGQMNDFVLNFLELDRALKLMVKVYKIKMHYYSFIRGKDKMKEYVYLLNEPRKRNDYPI